MAEERTYNIPLRKEWLKVPSYARTQKAIRTVRIFIQKHMKNKDVVMGKYLNQELWKRGSQTTPHKVSVTAKQVEEKDRKYVKVELLGAPEEKPKEEKKKGLLQKLTGAEEKKEETAEEKKEETKEEKKSQKAIGEKAIEHGRETIKKAVEGKFSKEELKEVEKKAEKLEKETKKTSEKKEKS